MMSDNQIVPLPTFPQVIELVSFVKDKRMVYSQLPPCGHPGGGGVLPYKRLMGMCRWMGSHFHDWSDYNGVAFSIELLEWGRKCSAVRGK